MPVPISADPVRRFMLLAWIVKVPLLIAPVPTVVRLIVPVFDVPRFAPRIMLPSLAPYV